MDEQLTNELSANGHLTADWRPSFLAVPRETFIPNSIWRQDKVRTWCRCTETSRDS